MDVIKNLKAEINRLKAVISYYKKYKNKNKREKKSEIEKKKHKSEYMKNYYINRIKNVGICPFALNEFNKDSFIINFND